MSGLKSFFSFKLSLTLLMMKNILLASVFLFSLSAYGDVIPPDVIDEWGYQANKKSRYLNEYCLGEVKPTGSAYQGIRSLKYSKELPEAKYRFTLARETYSSEGEAIKRERAILQPIDRNSKQAKLCDLRKAIRVSNVVYFVHSDVGAFNGELDVIFNRVVETIIK